MKMGIFQIKIFQKITLVQFMMYSFIELVSLPKSFHGPLDNEKTLQLALLPCYGSLFKQADNTVAVQ